MKKNQNGFGIVEIILILVLILIIGGISWILYHNLNNQTTLQSSDTKTEVGSKNDQSSKVSNSYIGWETYKSTTSSVSFQYPSSWKLEVTPSVNREQETMEAVGVSSPADSKGRVLGVGLQINSDTYSGKAPSRMVDKTIAINDNYLIMYNGDGSDDGVTSFALSKVNLMTGLTDSWFEQGLETATNKPLIIYGDLNVPGNQEPTAYPVSDYTNFPEWQNALLVIKSFKL